MSASRAPAYACLVPMLADVAREHGYALAVHGSMQRDLDLVAVPWVDGAAEAEVLVAALQGRVSWIADDAPVGPTVRAHGRRSWAITLYGGPYLDISVMPRGAVEEASGPGGRVLSRLLGRLPVRFRWTVHNLIAHPASEVLYQCGMEEAGNRLHDATAPVHPPGTGRG